MQSCTDELASWLALRRLAFLFPPAIKRRLSISHEHCSVANDSPVKGWQTYLAGKLEGRETDLRTSDHIALYGLPCVNWANVAQERNASGVALSNNDWPWLREKVSLYVDNVVFCLAVFGAM
ncbi:hypothetical protein TESG_08241 [Trichophyton tonsurans CBS 112818]|uniref:Uncharacterized protein n=1 Tax=Trichophyton tonsurans (strain CBS 112818) TaxID=647933 RepID=F2RN21_TRIT1|nr:hypothetical protein TESG_08241 [Trichophyton tonsurans CBS 112818]